jgi:hypothetical protein
MFASLKREGKVSLAGPSLYPNAFTLLEHLRYIKFMMIYRSVFIEYFLPGLDYERGFSRCTHAALD